MFFLVLCTKKAKGKLSRYDTFQIKTLKKESDIDFEIINDQILNFLEISAESTDWFC